MESFLESIFVDVDGRRCRHCPEAGETFSLLMSSRRVFESHLLFDRVRDANRGRLNQCSRGLLQETLTEELRGSPVTLRLYGFIRSLPMCSSASVRGKGPATRAPVGLPANLCIAASCRCRLCGGGPCLLGFRPPEPFSGEP